MNTEIMHRPTTFYPIHQTYMEGLIKRGITVYVYWYDGKLAVSPSHFLTIPKLFIIKPKQNATTA